MNNTINDNIGKIMTDREFKQALINPFFWTCIAMDLFNGAVSLSMSMFNIYLYQTYGHLLFALSSIAFCICVLITCFGFILNKEAILLKYEGKRIIKNPEILMRIFDPLLYLFVITGFILMLCGVCR